LGSVAFHLRIPRRHKRLPHERVSPNFIPAGTESATVQLVAVNLAPPPAGVVTSRTTRVNASTCGGVAGCTVLGPASPTGSDIFFVTLKDGSGHALAKNFAPAITVKPAAANSGSVTLQGVPASFTLTGMPSGIAGTPASNVSLTLTAFDAAGDTITGPYANSIELTDNDASGGTQVFVNRGNGVPVFIANSTDSVQISYTGLAIAATSLTIQAQGATTLNVPFAPSGVTNPAAVCNGAGGSDTTECATPAPSVQLYAPSSTGSTASFTVSQTGWSENPFSQPFQESDTCSGIATISSSDDVTFTATVAAAPSVGTCHVTITGGAALTLDVPVSYTTTGVGVDTRHRGRPAAPFDDPLRRPQFDSDEP
jgi:hypothetical protein